MCDIRLSSQRRDLKKLVLGLCLMFPKAFSLVSNKIASGDFYSPQNSLIYNTLKELVGLGEPIDIPLFCLFAKNRGILDGCGGAAYISSLLDGLPKCEEGNLLRYCEKLCLLSLQREIIKRCYQVTTVNTGINPEEEIKEPEIEIHRYFAQKELKKASSEGQNESVKFVEVINS